MKSPHLKAKTLYNILIIFLSSSLPRLPGPTHCPPDQCLILFLLCLHSHPVSPIFTCQNPVLVRFTSYVSKLMKAFIPPTHPGVMLKIFNHRHTIGTTQSEQTLAIDGEPLGSCRDGHQPSVAGLGVVGMGEGSWEDSEGFRAEGFQFSNGRGSVYQPSTSCLYALMPSSSFGNFHSVLGLLCSRSPILLCM